MKRAISCGSNNNKNCLITHSLKVNLSEVFAVDLIHIHDENEDFVIVVRLKISDCKIYVQIVSTDEGNSRVRE